MMYYCYYYIHRIISFYHILHYFHGDALML